MNNLFDPYGAGCLIDLHLHLDGALTADIVRELAAMQHIPLPADDRELRAMITVPEGCVSLTDYLKIFSFTSSLLRSGPALTLAVRRVLRKQKEQGVIYTEIRFAPQLSVCEGFSQEDAVLAALRGLRESEDCRAGLILCCLRGSSDDINLETLAIAKRWLGKGVCAVDLAGAEALWPTADYKPLLGRAVELGLPFTVHAGEAAGPESVDAAVSYGARRIGHGVRSVSDPAVMRRLADTRVTLELCPTSNLDTKAVSELSRYPLRTFMEYGIPVTVNTDDPAISDTDLRREWKLLTDAFSVTDDEARAILLNAADAAFTDDAEKEHLRNAINAYFSNK